MAPTDEISTHLALAVLLNTSDVLEVSLQWLISSKVCSLYLQVFGVSSGHCENSFCSFYFM